MRAHVTASTTEELGLALKKLHEAGHEANGATNGYDEETVGEIEADLTRADCLVSMMNIDTLEMGIAIAQGKRIYVVIDSYAGFWSKHPNVHLYPTIEAMLAENG